VTGLEPSGPQWRAQGPRRRGAEHARMSFVIVVGDPADRSLLCASLRALRMRVAVFASVFDAAAMLGAVVPDCVLLELGADAPAFARALRADDATRGVGIVGLKTERTASRDVEAAPVDLVISVRRALADVDPLCVCAAEAVARRVRRARPPADPT
jgi:hypothetical protein